MPQRIVRIASNRYKELKVNEPATLDAIVEWGGAEACDNFKIGLQRHRPDSKPCLLLIELLRLMCTHG